MIEIVNKERLDLCDGEHPAEEEPGEDVVVVSILPEPDLDLNKVVLGGGVVILPRRPHHQVTCYNFQFKLPQLKYHLHRHCLSHAHCYCSGSPRRMARIQKEKNIEKDHDQTRPVLQNSLKEAVIIFHSQKL